MNSNIKSAVAFGAGFVGGWAARSLADSPQGVGVKLLEVAMTAKERVSRWASVERERLEDMLEEARARAKPDISAPKKAARGPVRVVRAMNGDA